MAALSGEDLSRQDSQMPLNEENEENEEEDEEDEEEEKQID